MHLEAATECVVAGRERRLPVLLGARAAEAIAFREVSTGDALQEQGDDDLERATNRARQRLTLYGMGRSVGRMHGSRLGSECDRSESPAREIDAEVRRMLDAALGEMRALLVRRRDALETIAGQQVEQETIDARPFHELLGKPDERTLAEGA